MRTIRLTLLWVTLLLTSIGITGCLDDKRTGLFGRSETLEESRAIGHFRALYIPERPNIVLMDGTTIVLDTAWAESMGTYNSSGELKAVEKLGYTVHLPLSGQDFAALSFSLSILDKENQAFTNGMSEGFCDLHPLKLLDTIAVEVWERSHDDSVGWTSISTDTVLLLKQ